MIQEVEESIKDLQDKERRVRVGSTHLIALVDMSIEFKYRKERNITDWVKHVDAVTRLKVEELLPEKIYYKLTEDIVASVHLPTFLARLQKEFDINSQETKAPPVVEKIPPLRPDYYAVDDWGFFN